MLNSVTNQVPSDEIAKAVFYLVKEVGLTHKDIFGEKRYVNIVEPVSRDGILGETLDYIIGKEKKETTEEVKTPSMSLTAFQAYLDLFEEYQKEKKQQQKKQRMRQKFKNPNTI